MRSIDVRRLSLSEGDPSDAPPQSAVALKEFLSGDLHLALQLEDDQPEPTGRLLTTGGFVVFWAGGTPERYAFDRLFFRPRAESPQSTAERLQRYARHVHRLAPGSMEAPSRMVEAMRDELGVVLGAVVSLTEADKVSEEVDVLYVPKVWTELPPPPETTSEQHAVAQAAGWVVLGMSGPFGSPN